MPVWDAAGEIETGTAFAGSAAGTAGVGMDAGGKGLVNGEASATCCGAALFGIGSLDAAGLAAAVSPKTAGAWVASIGLTLFQLS